MIRFLLIVLFLAIFFICSLLIYPVLLVAGLISMDRRHKMSYAVVSWAFRFILFIAGTKITVIGRNRIPRDKAVLYVGNHRGFFDIVINYAVLPPVMGFVAKKEMKKIPFLSWWMMLVNCLFLDRKNIKEGLKTIIAGANNLKNGISMFIYPEGTRTRGDEPMLEFKEGSMKMAEKAGSLIIPVAMNNSSACFEDQFPRIKKAHVVVEYGEPIDMTKMSKEEVKHIGSYTRDVIQEMLDKNAELVLK
ncbi:MAG: 1-acyl-sn-glycerol-3-phosphate acyltransferase [Lachnospiraceae bacterium]|nr:1-acyl-sn-glycerol-3-phosphate acyltransferase [Lachnospiraceae bacterium]